MNTRNLVSVAALLLLAVAVMAADTTKTQQPQMPPMGPPPQMKDVMFLIGTWDVTTKFTMGDTTKWEVSTGTCKWESVADGCALFNTMEGTMMNMPFKGIGTTSFNRETGKWQMTWLDNMSAFISLYTGDFKDGKLVTSGEDLYQGQKMITRVTMHDITPTKFEEMFEMSTDGGKTFTVNGKAVYTKKS